MSLEICYTLEVPGALSAAEKNLTDDAIATTCLPHPVPPLGAAGTANNGGERASSPPRNLQTHALTATIFVVIGEGQTRT